MLMFGGQLIDTSIHGHGFELADDSALVIDVDPLHLVNAKRISEVPQFRAC